MATKKTATKKTTKAKKAGTTEWVQFLFRVPKALAGKLDKGKLQKKGHKTRNAWFNSVVKDL